MAVKQQPAILTDRCKYSKIFAREQRAIVGRRPVRVAEGSLTHRKINILTPKNQIFATKCFIGRSGLTLGIIVARGQ